MKYSNTDELIDAFLSKRKVNASGDFMAGFEARLAREKGGESEMDKLLALQKVRASSGFTDTVMRKIRTLKIMYSLKTIVPAFAAAASLALAFTIFSGSPRASINEASIYNELSLLDYQMSSFEQFATLSESFEPSNAALAAFFDDDSF